MELRNLIVDAQNHYSQSASFGKATKTFTVILFGVSIPRRQLNVCSLSLTLRFIFTRHAMYLFLKFSTDQTRPKPVKAE